tara:strand:- start:1835 stop:3058 length:1224 start_codon:yes stop_codon:yes gene_type:complete
MEAIFTIILIYGAYYLFFAVLGTGAKAVGAASKTVFEGGSFADNFSNKLQFKVEKLPREDKDSVDVFGIFLKGNPGVTSSSPVVLIFKLFDKETSLPILSTFEMSSEPDSRVFEHRVNLGDMNNKYWPDWSQVSGLIPDTLIGPHKGTRNLQLRCFIWDLNYQPVFVNGFVPEGSNYSGAIGIEEYDFSFNCLNPGYMETDNERLTIQKAAVKLAISIAMADGSIDQSEGNEIKKWIKGIVDSSIPSQVENIKADLNQALEDGFKEIKNDSINLKKICNEIKDIGSKVDKFDLIELCLDVMAADGEADKEELKQIEQISNFIGIDYKEISEMKDQRLIKLDPASSSLSGLEEKLDINPEWDKERINKHILSLYGKWNGRLNALPEGNARDNAQQMLDLIAEARRKYS